jgi:hypothetical protein
MTLASVKRVVPSRVRTAGRQAVRQARLSVAGRLGVLPDFLIVGAQKCGTTSLYDYLTAHPCVYPATVKEVGYFDRFYSRGLTWYRSHFPSRLQKYHAERIRRERFSTGEASTGYILNPLALRRIHALIPEARLILLLRNPVDRAFSAYQHTVRMRREPLSFEAAIEKEDERIGAAWARLLREESFDTIDLAHYAYLRTGIYADQVKALLSLFPREQLFVASTEAFAKEPGRLYAEVLRFLDLPPRALADDDWLNVGRYTEMDPDLRARLTSYFRPHNERLYKLLNVDFAWD